MGKHLDFTFCICTDLTGEFSKNAPKMAPQFKLELWGWNLYDFVFEISFDLKFVSMNLIFS